MSSLPGQPADVEPPPDDITGHSSPSRASRRSVQSEPETGSADRKRPKKRRCTRRTQPQSSSRSVVVTGPNVVSPNLPQSSANAPQCTITMGDVVAATTFWRQCVRDWYPNLHSQTYFLPPFHFNRVSYDVQTLAGQSVLVPKVASSQPQQAPVDVVSTSPPPHPSEPASRAYAPIPAGPLPVVYDSEVRDDRALQRVLNFIRDLAEREQEVMLVLSQLDFRKYLDNQVNPINAAAIRLPRSNTVKKDYKRGDFDVLMISSRYGLIVGEVKSVDPSKAPDLDKAVETRVQKAVKQLNKEGALLKHLISDLPFVNIIKTLMLPNITSTQLLQALRNNLTLQEDLCGCLNAPDTSSAVARCLCSDSLTSSPSEWWQRAVTDAGPDKNMTRDQYEVLVARFCGPATTIEVPTVTTPRRTVGLKTLSEAVALTGLTMAMLTLYPQQVNLVNEPELPRVFLWGPPGTGKTVVLVIKGLQWGQQGKDVHLLSTHRDSRAAILLIEQQLLHTPQIGFSGTSASGGSLVQTGTLLSSSSQSPSQAAPIPTPGPRVYTHFYDFANNKEDVEAAAEELASVARDGELLVIADEAFSGQVYDKTSGRFDAFCTCLTARVLALHLWAATVERHVTPSCLREELLTIPVRCPPATVKEVELSGHMGGRLVPRYSGTPTPSPTDGPAVKALLHWSHEVAILEPLPGHTGDQPEECGRCGDAVAHLMEELRVGKTDSGLQYRDIFILCEIPRDDLPVVTSLSGRGIPVQVLRTDDNNAHVRNVALAARDAVTVTDWRMISGLERRVVVVMWWGLGDNAFDRLHAMSRSTSLLVHVGDPLQSDGKT